MNNKQLIQFIRFICSELEYKRHPFNTYEQACVFALVEMGLL